MKLAQFRALIREEVKKVLKSRPVNEDYIKQVNMYDDAFANLSKQDYTKLNTLFQQFDKMTDKSDALFGLVSDVTDSRSFADAYEWQNHFETVADEPAIKRKFPKAAQIASQIAAIVSKVA